MIKHTQMLFELGNMRAYSVSTLSKLPPPLQDAPPYLQEVYFYTVSGGLQQGPFESLYVAMKHYAAYKRKDKDFATEEGEEVHPAAPPETVISVDFKTKKRV